MNLITNKQLNIHSPLLLVLSMIFGREGGGRLHSSCTSSPEEGAPKPTAKESRAGVMPVSSLEILVLSASLELGGHGELK